MGYWTKRTEQEIENSVQQRDYTGGYKFWPWLFWVRKGHTLGFLLNLIFGWVGGISLIKDDPSTFTNYGVFLFFGIFTPILIGFLLRRDYKESKKGITR